MQKWVLSIICILLASMLQGCIVGAVVAGGAAGCAVAADRRSFSTMAQDQKITYKINKQIGTDKDIVDNSHIVVVTYNHVVLLAGQTATPEMRSRIEELAHQVPGTRRIFNEMTIGKPIPTARRSKDGTTTVNVKTRLMATTNVSARQVKVVTENGTVYLMGVMSRDQANTAAQVARNSTGVQRVVKLIEYGNF